MSKFSIGTKVLIDDGRTQGVIESIYENLKTAIVKTDDNDVRKVSFSEMIKNNREEILEDIISDSAVTLTKEEFVKRSYEILKNDESLQKEPLMLLMAIGVMGTLVKGFFPKDSEK